MEIGKSQVRRSYQRFRGIIPKKMDKRRTRAMRWKEKRVFLIVSSSGKDNFSYKNTRFTVSAGLVIRQERNYQWMTSSMMLFLARQCREIIKLLNFIDPHLNESLKGRK